MKNEAYLIVTFEGGTKLPEMFENELFWKSLEV